MLHAPHAPHAQPHHVLTWMTSQSPRVNVSSGSSCTRVPFSSEVCSWTVTTWPLVGRLEPGGPGTSVFFLSSPFPAKGREQTACPRAARTGGCLSGRWQSTRAQLSFQ